VEEVAEAGILIDGQETQMTSCRSAEVDHKKTLARPGPIGAGVRAAVALAFFTGGVLARSLPPLALALGAFGVLLALAALVREPGCEVNLVWKRLFGRRAIDCMVFGPVDRWERRRTASPR
jgi:hypothetical protein